ncbi:MAG: NAD(P)-dependent oxidoreductase [Alphaproteobacteria bacterium]|nr:NAD(P)-dependent oxidoreductase [Alphaproteobacteria bacterium]
MATIAFLGLGIMGAPMAVNLVRAGFDVMGWNRTSSKATPVREAGGAVAKTPAEAVEGAEFILSILDSGPVVREVFFDSGAVDHMLSGAVFIDMASIPPKMAQAHATLLKEVGVGHLDAPVSGGSLGAAEGSLAIMAGGEKADFDRAEAAGVFKPMGRASYIGPAGSGQIAKLANQIMVAVNISGVAQALLLASAGGADPAQIPEALSGGHGDSRVLQEHGRRMIGRDFRPGAPIRNFVKDLNTVLETAGDLKVRLPIVEAVRDVFQDLYDKGLTRHDHSAFLLHLEELNTPVRLGTGADITPE